MTSHECFSCAVITAKTRQISLCFSSTLGVLSKLLRQKFGASMDASGHAYIKRLYVATDWSLSCFPQLFRKDDTLRAQHAPCASDSRLGNDRRLANKNPDSKGNSSINLLPRSMGFISWYLVVGSQFPKALILAQYEVLGPAQASK